MYKDDFWETCTEFNDCSRCPLSTKDEFDNFKCSVDQDELKDRY